MGIFQKGFMIEIEMYGSILGTFLSELSKVDDHPKKVKNQLDDEYGDRLGRVVDTFKG
jgi:hypothetical protein